MRGKEAALAFDTGDTLFPPGNAALTDADRHRADLLAQGFAQLSYTALAVGETDLRDGLQPLLERAKAQKLEYLAANLVDASGAHPFGSTKVIDTPQGKVGVVGVTVFDQDVAGLHATDAIAALKDASAQLRKLGVVAVIALVHGPTGKIQTVLEHSDVDLALAGHEGRQGMFVRTPPTYGSGQKGRGVNEVHMELGEGPLVDANATDDAKNEVELLDRLYGTLQQRLATATNDQAKKSMQAQLDLNRKRRGEADARAHAPINGRAVSWKLVNLDEQVASDPDWQKRVDAEVAADGHSPAR